MDELLLIARAVLALVFLTSALTKFADREGTQEAIVGFGVPQAIARPGAVLLPLAELVVAIALIPVSTALWGAAGALGLLLLFIVGISVNLAQGRKPDCNCFGQLHSEPVGASTLVRNGLLSALAALVIWGPEAPGPSYATYLSELSSIDRLALIGGLAALALLALQGMLWWSLLRQHGRLISRVDFLEKALQEGGTFAATEGDAGSAPFQGLPVASVAPSFTLSGLYGETLTLQALLARGKPALLIFTDPACGPCNELMPDVAQWQQSPVANATIALISRGSVEANQEKANTYGLANILLQEDTEVADAYNYNGTPCGIVIGTDGTISQPMSCGAPAIRDLAATLMGELLPMANGNGNGAAPAPAGLAIGEEAPQIALKNLAGKTVKLSDFKGRETLLLFWDPGCGFCQNIRDDIKAWEESAPEDAPDLVMVTTNDTASNMAEGFRAPMLLDEGFAMGNQYSAPGTPSAVLIDAEGRIASEVAVGGPAVLALAGATPADA